MEKLGAADRGVALKHASRIKGLANTMKNYRGKLKGLKRLGLVDRRREQEAGLQAFILADPERRASYGALRLPGARPQGQKKGDGPWWDRPLRF